MLLTTGVAPRIPKLQAVPSGEAEPGTGGGGIIGHGADVVNVHTKFAANVLPNVSAAPVVMVAVNDELEASAAVGVNVATLVAATYVTAPATGVLPEVTVNVVLLIVPGFIGLLKVAVTIAVFGQTSNEPFGGVTAVTVGGFVGLVGATGAPPLSGSPHPGVTTAIVSSNANTKILFTFNLLIFASPNPFLLVTELVFDERTAVE
jgi:hypothetical protein